MDAAVIKIIHHHFEHFSHDKVQRYNSTKMENYKCDRCKRNFARKDTLTRHKNRINQCYIANNNASHIIDVTTSKISEKKVVEKQPHCNEIIHFKTSEFKDGKPKSLETLNKLYELVNSELPPSLHAEKNIGMGNNNAILAAPAIGFVDASVPGAPGHPLHANELKEILKPIHPASNKITSSCRGKT